MEIPTADGGRVWVECHGSGDPVLLLPGMCQSHLGMVGQFALKKQFTVITMDYRGTGLSSDWAEDQQPLMGDFVEDALTVLDELNIARTHIVGFSMGGRIAQWLAIRFPRRVGGLVLIATSPGEQAGGVLNEEVDLIYTQGNPIELISYMYSPQWVRYNSDVVQNMLDAISERGRQRKLHARASYSHNSWDSLPTITAPTLVIHGEEDKINPIENSRLMIERIPGAEQFVIKAGRHAVGAEYADVVNSEIAAFLGKYPILPA